MLEVIRDVQGKTRERTASLWALLVHVEHLHWFLAPHTQVEGPQLLKMGEQAR